MKQLNTYIIEGGIGKCSTFSALIPELVKKSGQGIQVLTPYFHAFGGNPDVSMVFDQKSIDLNDDRIMKSDNIFYCEPYKSNFQFGEQHIIESYCNHFGVKYNKNMKPKLFTDQYTDETNKWLEENKIKDFVLVQLSGGQAVVEQNVQNQYVSSNPGRNYPHYLASEVIRLIKGRYKNLTIIDVTPTNEPAYPDTIKLDKHWIYMHELLKKSKGFIAIDSCLQHFAASTENTGVVIWGNTRWTQFGYEENKNLHYHMKKGRWVEQNHVPSDPRNIMVDPNEVFRAYIETQK